MRNHIIFFSGGKSSFAVADYVKEKYPEDNIVLYFTDTLWEDEDLYRFIYEASDKLQLPMLTHSRGITPPELMVEQRFMANNRVGTCSKELKMKVAARYLKKGIVPEVEKWHNKHYLKNDNFVEGAILYFGISFMEMHREGPIRENWKPFQVEMPLIENDIDNDAILAKHGIKQPRMYDLQFAHNNCKGRCVKAGQGHFKNLKMKDPATFYELLEFEVILNDYIRYMRQPGQRSGQVKDYLYKDVIEFARTGEKSYKIDHLLRTTKYRRRNVVGTDSKGQPIKKPYTFMKSMSLYELDKQPIQCDMWDIGGCGCFVEYEDSSTVTSV